MACLHKLLGSPLQKLSYSSGQQTTLMGTCFQLPQTLEDYCPSSKQDYTKVRVRFEERSPQLKLPHPYIPPFNPYVPPIYSLYPPTYHSLQTPQRVPTRGPKFPVHFEPPISSMVGASLIMRSRSCSIMALALVVSLHNGFRALSDLVVSLT